MKPADKVIQLNKWIKEYADKNGFDVRGLSFRHER